MEREESGEIAEMSLSACTDQSRHDEVRGRVGGRHTFSSYPSLSSMKDTLADANFPRTASGATYHLGAAPGQLANRIIIVGDFSRARRIAKHFDETPFELHSSRQFLTLTGTYRSTPVSVVAIGMGFPLVDFFLREARAVIEGQMFVVRLGSCGSLDEKVGLGSVVVPRRSHGILRNYDYFHADTTDEERAKDGPYHVTKGIDVADEVHDALVASLEATRPKAASSSDLFGGRSPSCVGRVINGSADSFYSSQGRNDPSFFDDNEGWTDTMAEKWSIQTLEMETFILQSLALAANKAAQAAGHGDKRRIETGAVQMM